MHPTGNSLQLGYSHVDINSIESDTNDWDIFNLLLQHAWKMITLRSQRFIINVVILSCQPALEKNANSFFFWLVSNGFWLLFSTHFLSVYLQVSLNNSSNIAGMFRLITWQNQFIHVLAADLLVDRMQQCFDNCTFRIEFLITAWNSSIRNHIVRGRMLDFHCTKAKSILRCSGSPKHTAHRSDYWKFISFSSKRYNQFVFFACSMPHRLHATKLKLHFTAPSEFELQNSTFNEHTED